MSDRTPRTPSGDGYLFSVDQLCLYPGRACYHLRDLKRNGQLHRFCRTHRERHNQYQRESQERRQRRREAAQMRMLLHIEWGVALDQLEATSDSVTDAELFSMLHELFGGPDAETAPDGLAEYQQIDIDPLPDDPKNSHRA